MIPKIIHYIWLGKNKKPKTFNEVFSSWKKYANGFEIKEWSEDNISEFELPEYYHRAIKEKKWAFASDVLRVYILNKYGGLYFDIDQVLVKDINPEFLKYNFFTATFHEVDNYYGFQYVGCTANNIVIQKLIEYYQGKNNSNFIIINKILSDIINLLKIDDADFINRYNIKIFPQEYFYPLTEKDFTENTYSFHLGNTSWQPKWKHLLYKYKIYFYIKDKLKKFLPNKIEY